MKSRTAFAATGLVALGMAAGGIAAASGDSGGSSTSRLDDGGSLRSKAAISEQQAIAAAQGKAGGALNEVDLEYAHGTLVYNVDVGSKDVKVDAATGDVLSVDGDD